MKVSSRRNGRGLESKRKIECRNDIRFFFRQAEENAEFAVIGGHRRFSDHRSMIIRTMVIKLAMTSKGKKSGYGPMKFTISLVPRIKKKTARDMEE